MDGCIRLADLMEIEGGVEYMVMTHKDDIGEREVESCCCRSYS